MFLSPLAASDQRGMHDDEITAGRGRPMHRTVSAAAPRIRSATGAARAVGTGAIV